MTPRATAFGAWAYEGLGALSAAQESLVAYAVADTLACLVLGAGEASTRAVSRALGGHEVTGGSLAVDGRRLTPSGAAAVNATAAHARDFDDNFTPGMSHASAVLVPALLAVAQRDPALMARVPMAYTVGLQAQAFVGSVVGHRHYVDGWHGTSTVGCIGTAAAVAHLEGRGAEGVARAMAVAASFAGGTKAQFGTAMKPVHAGLAARNAVDAAALTAQGIDGSAEVLEAPQGVRELFGRGDGDDGLAWLGSALALDRPGVLPKVFPSCGSTHLVLDAIGDLRERRSFHVRDVESVEATIGPANHGSLPFDVPATPSQARFSMRYCVETLLVTGTLGLADFAEERVAEYVRRPRPFPVVTRAWRPDEAPAGAAPDQPPHRVTLRFRDGTALTHSRDLPRGAVGEAFTDAERRQKFGDCVGDPAAAGPLYDRILAFPGSADGEALWETIDLASGRRAGG